MASLPIQRQDIASLIETELSGVLLDQVKQQSVATRIANIVPLAPGMTEFPVFTKTAYANWVSESPTDADGVKPLSNIEFKKKTIAVAELATIIAVHENFLTDPKFDVSTYIVNSGATAIAAALDAAVLFGINRPQIWQDKSMFESAVAAGSVVQASGDYFTDLVNVMKKQDVTYNPDTVVAHKYFSLDIQNMRSSIGVPIYLPGNVMDAKLRPDGKLFDLDTVWVNGSLVTPDGTARQIWDPKTCTAMVFDRSRIILGIREDIQVKYLTEATVGGINLAERDHVAFRFKARYGFAINDAVTGYDRYVSPISILVPAGGDAGVPPAGGNGSKTAK